jgi:hypothetical protein
MPCCFASLVDQEPDGRTRVVAVGIEQSVVVVLARADLATTALPDGFVRPAAWVIVAYFLLGIGMNLASRSTPERNLMAPVSAVLCALCTVVAAN